MILNQLRKKIISNKNLEKKNISTVLLWLKKRQNLDKTKVKLFLLNL